VKNPYPEKIFPPIEEEEWRRIDELLRKELGFPLDRVSGNIGRIVWNNLMEDVKSAVQGLLEEIEKKQEEILVVHKYGEGFYDALKFCKNLIKKWFADVVEERVK